MSNSIMVTPAQRDPVQHELKTWPAYFGAVASGRKAFELRRDDRPFRKGDTLRLREWCPVEKAYSGREVWAEVTYIMRKDEDFGLMDGFCLMGINVTGIPAATLAGLRDGSLVAVDKVALTTVMRYVDARYQSYVRDAFDEAAAKVSVTLAAAQDRTP